VNTIYYIETIDFRVREKIFKHHGGRVTNVALFLIFARFTNTMRTNLTNKRNAPNAGNGNSGLQISKMFWWRIPPASGIMHPLWKTSTPSDKSSQIRP
jgi:hypothetical protein